MDSVAGMELSKHDHECERNAISTTLFQFVSANILVAYVYAHFYLLRTNMNFAGPGWVFAATALLAQIGFLFVLLGFCFMLLSRFYHPNTAFILIVSSVYSLLLILLFLDTRVYSIFKFHINGLVWNIITTKGGWESMHIPTRDVVSFSGLCLAVVWTEFKGFSEIRYILTAKRFMLPQAKRSWILLSATFILLLFAEKVVYAISDLRQVREITVAERAVPLYQPLTIRKMARRFGINTDHMSLPPPDHTKEGLSYPRQPLVYNTPKKMFNYVWLIIDGWRSDAFSPEITPHLWQFGKKCQVFSRHLSGGNSTRFGIFSLYYGLYGAYWPTFLNEGRGPVFIDRLKEMNYRFKILSGVPLTSPEFRQTVFSQVVEFVSDELPGQQPWEKDQMMMSELPSFLSSARSSHFFISVLFDSTHIGYSFPPDRGLDPFRPYLKSVYYSEYGNAYHLVEDMNRYKNSVYYVDHLIGNLLEDMERKKLLENTVVLVTGDHGEAFGENGYWGHNSSFSDEQVHVPFLLYVSSMKPQTYNHPTSHHDVVPTIMRFLGTLNPSDDYSLGQSMFQIAAASRTLVSCGWDECAAINDTSCIVFGTRSYKLARPVVYGRDYKERSDRSDVLNVRMSDLTRIMSELGKYFRSSKRY